MQIVTRKHVFLREDPTKMEVIRQLGELMNWVLLVCKRNDDDIEDLSFIYHDRTLTGSESIEVIARLDYANAEGQ
jgi:hypothetical protein